MKRIFVSLFIITLFFNHKAFAEISPLIELYGAQTWAQWEPQSIDVPVFTGLPPDEYRDTSDTEEAFGWGVLLGVEISEDNFPLYLQAGITYDYVTSVPVNGDVFFLGDPEFNELRYAYDIQHQRLGGAIKVLWGLDNWYPPLWFPYVEVGIARAWNKTINFQETILNPNLVTTRPMGGETTKSFSYSVGAGIERIFAENWRVGIGYLYTHAGNFNLTNNHPNINVGEDTFEKKLRLQQVLISVSFMGWDIL